MLAALSRNKLSGLAQKIQPIKQAFNMVQSAGNPQMMAQQMLGNNPQFAQAQKIIADNGGDAQKAFYATAQKMGIDPNDILNALK